MSNGTPYYSKYIALHVFKSTIYSRIFVSLVAYVKVYVLTGHLILATGVSQCNVTICDLRLYFLETVWDFSNVNNPYSFCKYVQLDLRC